MTGRIDWPARIRAVIARIGPATLHRIAAEVVGSTPTRSKLSACGRAARRMAQRGELAAGRTYETDASGRRVVTPCYGPPGEALPQAMPLRGIGREVGVSHTTVRRLLMARKGTVSFRASSNLEALTALPPPDQAEP